MKCNLREIVFGLLLVSEPVPLFLQHFLRGRGWDACGTWGEGSFFHSSTCDGQVSGFSKCRKCFSCGMSPVTFSGFSRPELRWGEVFVRLFDYGDSTSCRISERGRVAPATPGSNPVPPNCAAGPNGPGRKG